MWLGIFIGLVVGIGLTLVLRVVVYDYVYFPKTIGEKIQVQIEEKVAEQAEQENVEVERTILSHEDVYLENVNIDDEALDANQIINYTLVNDTAQSIYYLSGCTTQYTMYNATSETERQSLGAQTSSCLAVPTLEILGAGEKVELSSSTFFGIKSGTNQISMTYSFTKEDYHLGDDKYQAFSDINSLTPDSDGPF